MKWLDYILKAVLVALLVAMSLDLATNVFCRFVLHFSIYWADEVAQILLVWLTFLGAALAVRDQSHYALGVLVERVHGTARVIVDVVSHVAGIAAISVLLYFSAEVSGRISTWVMPATEISRSWVYGACPVGCALMLIYAIHGAWKALLPQRQP